MHHLLLGRDAFVRPLTDIDFIVDTFDCIPESLSQDFLFRHVHPSDPPGRIVLQLIDPKVGIRIDIFRAFGRTMERALKLSLPSGPVQLIALEDLVARTARMALDVTGGVRTPAKYARDFLRLTKLVHPEQIEQAWYDQRKSTQPATFKEADELLRYCLPASHHLLFEPEYSKTPDQACPRCKATPNFRLVDPSVMLSLLGYC